jgi:CBS domain-containing protein
MHGPNHAAALTIRAGEASMTTVAELLKLKDEQHRVPHTVSPEQMVFEVITLMAEKNIGAVPVVRDGKVVGIVSERDYVRKMELKGRASVGTPVSEIMTHDVKTVDSHHTVDQCMNIMTDRRLRHLPVVDDGRLVGLLSIGDLVKAAIAEQARLIEKMQEYIRGESY